MLIPGITSAVIFILKFVCFFFVQPCLALSSGKKKVSELKFMRINNFVSWLVFFLASQKKFLNILCDLQEEKQTDQTYHMHLIGGLPVSP